MLVGGKEGQDAKLLCTVCGGELKEDGECKTCGARHELKDGETQVTPLDAEKTPKETFLEEVSSISGLGPAKAEVLFNAGYTDIALLAKASAEELAQIEGFGETLAGKIHEHFHRGQASEGGGAEAVLESWLKGEAEDLESWLGGQVLETDAKEGQPAALRETKAEGTVEEAATEEAKPSSPPKGALQADAADALRRWLLGQEEDLEAWLAQPEPTRAKEAAPAPPSETDKGEDVSELRAELLELKKTLKSELDNLQGGNFDPVRYLEEIAKLNRRLQQEVQKRREAEGELDHMKKSSVAVFKYVRSQKSQEEGPEARRKIEEESGARKRLEIEVKKLQSLLEKANQEMKTQMKELPKDSKVLKETEMRLAEKEAELQAKEEELRILSEEVASKAKRIAEEELEQRLQAELTEKERDFLDKEAELKKRVIELVGEVESLKIDAKLRAEAMEMAKLPGEHIDERLVEKASELQKKEKDLLLKEEEVRRLREELVFKEEEFKKLKEPVAYKEEEMLRREEDLIYREKLLEAEKRKVEHAKAQVGNVEEIALKERLETLKGEISKKEEEVRAREKYLKGKMEELRLREQGIIEEDIESREEERKLELKQEKAKTGTPRLDDLLLGGIPFGSNVSIYGPPFIGKEVIVNAFIAEGLKKGIPALWIITDKTPHDIREEMQYVLPGYEEYEHLGLVRYVDAYSKGMGAEEEDANVTYVEDPTDHEAILRAADETAEELKSNHPYYRLAFRSISTLIAYLDPATTFRFLQPFAGRRKRDRAISFYVLEKGMHGEQEIQLLGSVMDGMVEFKVEQLKTYLSVRGISDVQSRAWIQYMYSKQGLSIGSFSLDHIR